MGIAGDTLTLPRMEVFLAGGLGFAGISYLLSDSSSSDNFEIFFNSITSDNILNLEESQQSQTISGAIQQQFPLTPKIIYNQQVKNSFLLPNLCRRNFPQSPSQAA